MTANQTRGEVALELDGVRYTLRPSYEAIMAFEKGTGFGLLELVRQTEDLSMAIETASIVVTECIRAGGRAEKNEMKAHVSPRKIGELMLTADGGLIKVLVELRVLLSLAATGGLTAEGERKAAGESGATPAAS